MGFKIEPQFHCAPINDDPFWIRSYKSREQHIDMAWVSISGVKIGLPVRDQYRVEQPFKKHWMVKIQQLQLFNAKPAYDHSRYNVVKIDKEQVHVNPIILFTRLTAIAEWEDDVKKYFSFEMTPYPPSLLKDGLMRRADKAALRRALMGDDEAVGKDQIDENSYVVNGGALLHRGRWFKDSTFNALAQLYVFYIRRWFCSCYLRWI